MPHSFDIADHDRQLLAPTGRLRVGVIPGSPLSMVAARDGGKKCGLGHDLGAAFAARLGVEVDYITFERIADVIMMMKAGEVDFTVSNATAARAEHVDFSQTLISLELGYLVPAQSTLAGAEEIDRAGMQIGVAKGSTSERTLPSRFAMATVVPAANYRSAIEMLRKGELDAYATNKPTLYEMSDAMPGSRVLDENWGLEHIALAIPKGRHAALETLKRFVAELQANGELRELQERAGLRGVVAASS
jgi:polar amino acid transport system substrate-binding protein